MNKLLIAALCAAVPFASAAADDGGLPAAGNWKFSQAGGFADVGQADRGLVSLVLPTASKHFELRFESASWDGLPPARVRVSVQFVGGNTYNLAGFRQGNVITVPIADDQVAAWTHDFTAQSQMNVSFPLMNEPAWTMPLRGTTPTVSYMAKAIELSGLTGLPAPWNPFGNAPGVQAAMTTPVAPTPLAVSHPDCIAAGAPMWVGGVMSPDAAVERERACEQGYVDRAAQARRDAQARAQQAILEEQARIAAQQAADERRRQQEAAENSPDNHCAEPDSARMIMREMGDFKVFKARNIEVIDIEHLTTITFGDDKVTMACYGVFVTNSGFNLTGTFSVRKNIAGDPIDSWRPDN